MASPDGYSALDGSERPRPDAHRLVGPVEADKVIGVTIILRPRSGSPPLPSLDAPPGRPRILSADEYAQTYGAAEADLDAVTAFAADHGLTVTERHAGRRSVTATGTAAQLNAAFGVTLNYYEAPRPPEVAHERCYRSCEADVEALVRYAWAERVVVTVISPAHRAEEPARIILRRGPLQLYGDMA